MTTPATTLISAYAVAIRRHGQADLSNVSLDGYIEDEHGRFD